MKQVKERLSVLISSFFKKRTLRNDIAEFSSIVNKMSVEDLFESLEAEWSMYDGIPGSFADKKKTLKHIIDIKNQPKQKKRFELRPNLYMLWKVAAILIVAVSGYVMFQTYGNADLKDKNIVIATLPGERVSIELPDGSIVQLNAASKLTYSSNFNQHNRIVILDGEAYFDIKKSKTDKFVVQTSTHKVEVMGTQFNVQTYKNEARFELTLLTGKVKVRKADDTDTAIILKPNEKYEFNYKTQELTVHKTNLETETAWLRGELIIRDRSLAQTISQLERFYGVSINDSSLAVIENEVFTGRFKRGNVEEALKVISMVYPVKYIKTNDSIVLTLIKY